MGAAGGQAPQADRTGAQGNYVDVGEAAKPKTTVAARTANQGNNVDVPGATKPKTMTAADRTGAQGNYIDVPGPGGGKAKTVAAATAAGGNYVDVPGAKAGGNNDGYAVLNVAGGAKTKAQTRQTTKKQSAKSPKVEHQEDQEGSELKKSTKIANSATAGKHAYSRIKVTQAVQPTQHPKTQRQTRDGHGTTAMSEKGRSAKAPTTRQGRTAATQASNATRTTMNADGTYAEGTYAGGTAYDNERSRAKPKHHGYSDKTKRAKMARLLIKAFSKRNDSGPEVFPRLVAVFLIWLIGVGIVGVWMWTGSNWLNVLKVAITKESPTDDSWCTISTVFTTADAETCCKQNVGR